MKRLRWRLAYAVTVLRIWRAKRAGDLAGECSEIQALQDRTYMHELGRRQRL